MPEPVIVQRADHILSRREIDPDALKVLYRLHQNQHLAYLVGGSVRDLLLGRPPKDFDIGTDAHPYQIKKLFRNCWIIGRRFRLAHIKFGQKTIEVATFRKNIPDLPPEAPAEENSVVVASAGPVEAPQEAPVRDVGGEIVRDPTPDEQAGMIHRDNTFGTPEEDAFRRDFTINGMFYDIATFALIDYVGGLRDLEQKIIRSIGDPNIRFVEDPVRMFRAAVFAARLGFEMDELVLEAIARHRALILKASPARLLEEYFKILRSGYAEASFRALKRVRLLELVTPELKSPSAAVWESLARLDRYRRRFPSAPAELTNTILAGALLMPLGALERRAAAAQGAAHPRHLERVSFGMLQVAKKDLERLRHMNMLLPRLADPSLPPRVIRNLPQRPAFPDAMSWLEIYGDSPELLEQWKQAHQARSQEASDAEPGQHPPGIRPPAGPRRRRRRRRGRGRGGRGRGGAGGEGPPAA